MSNAWAAAAANAADGPRLRRSVSILKSETRRGKGRSMYTVYSIRTQVIGRGVTKVEWRRFSDFLILQNNLLHSACDIPHFLGELSELELPPKSWFKRMHPEFVAIRRRGLEEFLRGVVIVAEARQAKGELMNEKTWEVLDKFLGIHGLHVGRGSRAKSLYVGVQTGSVLGANDNRFGSIVPGTREAEEAAKAAARVRLETGGRFEAESVPPLRIQESEIRRTCSGKSDSNISEKLLDSELQKEYQTETKQQFRVDENNSENSEYIQEKRGNAVVDALWAQLQATRSELKVYKSQKVSQPESLQTQETIKQLKNEILKRDLQLQSLQEKNETTTSCQTEENYNAESVKLMEEKEKEIVRLQDVNRELKSIISDVRVIASKSETDVKVIKNKLKKEKKLKRAAQQELKSQRIALEQMRETMVNALGERDRAKEIMKNAVVQRDSIFDMLRKTTSELPAEIVALLKKESLLSVRGKDGHEESCNEEIAKENVGIGMNDDAVREVSEDEDDTIADQYGCIAETPRRPRTMSQLDYAEKKKLLTNFYKRYNPGHVARVDNLLTKYAGNEKELFAELEKKYIGNGKNCNNTSILNVNEEAALSPSGSGWNPPEIRLSRESKDQNQNCEVSGSNENSKPDNVPSINGRLSVKDAVGGVANELMADLVKLRSKFSSLAQVGESVAARAAKAASQAHQEHRRRVDKMKQRF
eukprot:g3912.t1